jgi:protein TonB
MKSILLILFIISPVLITFSQTKQRRTGVIFDEIDTTRCEPWVKKVQPIYPDSALKNNIEGKVVLKARVGKDGRVKNVILLSSSDSIFNEAAIKAMKKWIFEPAISYGKSIEVWVTVPFNFKLKD